MDISERLKKRDKCYRRYHWFVMNAFVRTISRLLTGKGAKSILDVGTGSGTAAIKLKALLPDTSVYGLDIREGLVRLAVEKSRDSRGGYFLVGDVHNLPFRKDAFDCVIGKSTFCCWKRPLKGLTEIKRVMKKDGLVIFFEQNPRSVVARLYVALGIGDFIFRGLVDDESYGGIFNSEFFLGISYPREKIRQMLRQVGVGRLRVQNKILGAFYLIVFDFSHQKS